ncbi:MAG: DNA cytosine methyltransferase [Phycisphaerae bacterium]
MRSIELFAGAGGLALGTAKAGFRHTAVLEKERNACETLRWNTTRGPKEAKNWKILEGDVAEYDFRVHEGEIDLVSGGPPCQPFSIGGKHRGYQDQRDMFPQAVRAIRETRPKAFLFENVKGLLRQNFANYFSYIIHQLRYPEVVPRGDEEWTDHLRRLEAIHTKGNHAGLSYNVVYQLLNAADYGVPQRRERVFIVGLRNDLSAEFSFPHATHGEDALVYEKWVSGEYWERHRIPKAKRPQVPERLRRRVERLSTLIPDMLLKPSRTVRDAISDLPSIVLGRTCTKVPNHYLNPGARSYPGHTGSAWDEPAKTLKAGDHGVPGGENTLRLADGSVRYFTVRECARLQTFPDDWVFQGSWTESMRQLGNAVPVKLAEVVGARLAKVLRALSQPVGQLAGEVESG